ncbi:MAG: Na/Pi cotransporter family protein [Thermoplasmata archaeon]|nr:Na/Pi cotransporter family protein [Thermoplasmata archaeon]
MDATVAILTLLAGIGVFLIACSMLSSNLEAICSNKLRNLFARASDKKLVGVGIGTVATAAIQSSGATTVLVIGFVNAGIMSLTLAAAVIYGANIGTTITAQIVAWGGSLSLTMWFAAAAGIGAFVAAYAKKAKTRNIGIVVAAFGMLFVGLELMQTAMEDFAQEQSVMDFLSSVDNIVILVLLGAALTAIVQSSSVMTSVIIVMLAGSMITLDQGIYMTLGSNIGSCVVAIMAGFTSGINAKRTALIHLLFNVIGVVIFVIAGFAMGVLFDTSFGDIFGRLFASDEIDLAMFHTVFNIITVIIMIPFTAALIRLVMRIIPDREMPPEEADAPRLYYVDDHMLKTPAIAVMEVKNEIVNMADIAMSNVTRACSIVTTLDFSEAEAFKKCEKQLNYTNKQLTRFLTKLSNAELGAKDNAYISTAFRTITDIERVGDYAENIVGYAEKLQAIGEGFSPAAQQEIEHARATIESLYLKVMETYKSNDRELLKQAHDIEQSIDALTEEMAEAHIRRLSDGTCTVSVGAEFLALTSDLERVADHFYNVGKTVKEVAKSKA